MCQEDHSDLLPETTLRLSSATIRLIELLHEVFVCGSHYAHPFRTHQSIDEGLFIPLAALVNPDLLGRHMRVPKEQLTVAISDAKTVHDFAALFMTQSIGCVF